MDWSQISQLTQPPQLNAASSGSRDRVRGQSFSGGQRERQPRPDRTDPRTDAQISTLARLMHDLTANVSKLTISSRPVDKIKIPSLLNEDFSKLIRDQKDLIKKFFDAQDAVERIRNKEKHHRLIKQAQQHKDVKLQVFKDEIEGLGPQSLLVRWEKLHEKQAQEIHDFVLQIHLERVKRYEKSLVLRDFREKVEQCWKDFSDKMDMSEAYAIQLYASFIAVAEKDFQDAVSQQKLENKKRREKQDLFLKKLAEGKAEFENKGRDELVLKALLELGGLSQEVKEEGRTKSKKAKAKVSENTALAALLKANPEIASKYGLELKESLSRTAKFERAGTPAASRGNSRSVSASKSRRRSKSNGSFRSARSNCSGKSSGGRGSSSMRGRSGSRNRSSGSKRVHSGSRGRSSSSQTKRGPQQKPSSSSKPKPKVKLHASRSRSRNGSSGRNSGSSSRKSSSLRSGISSRSRSSSQKN